MSFFLRPRADLFDPLTLVSAIKFTPIDPGGFQQTIQLINRITPLLLDLVNARENVFMPGGQRFVIGRRSLDNRCFPLQIAIDISQQRLRPFPRFKNHLRNVAGQRVAVPTPEVRAGLIAQQRFILYQLLFEQHARLKGVKAEHTLTKTVDGKHRRFIHLSFSQ